MSIPRVSVVMSTGSNRIGHLRRTLQSWERATYPNLDFTLVSNGGDCKKVEEVYNEFSYITNFVHRNDQVPGNVNWTEYGREATGEFVIFAMADELLGEYDVIEQMLKIQDRRVSVTTYFLGVAQTEALDSAPWLEYPTQLEDYPNFWDHTEIENFRNRDRHNNGGILAHITGASREWWKWFGWFRTDKFGYLNMDRDVVVRENFLKCPCMPISKCYHQYHPAGTITPEHRLGGYFYENELQARLQEPAHGRT